MSNYSDTLFEQSEKMGDQIQLIISNEGIMRVFFNDDDGFIHSIVNKNSNFRHIINASKENRNENIKFYNQDIQSFFLPRYGGEKNERDVRTPYFHYKYNNENGKAIVFNFQERYYIQPDTNNPLYNSGGYTTNNILPKLKSYTSNEFLDTDFNEVSERFWNQYYYSLVYYDGDDIFNTLTDEAGEEDQIFLRELMIGSIDTYDIVNSEFNIPNITNSTNEPPIRIAPYKRLLPSREKTKFMKMVMPKKIYLDSNYKTNNVANEEYYKGIFVLYPISNNIQLIRLNQIGQIGNPGGIANTQTINLNEEISLPEYDGNYHCDIILDLSDNTIGSDFNNIYARPFFTYCTADWAESGNANNDNCVLAFGFSTYNLTLASEVKQCKMNVRAKKPKLSLFTDGEKDWISNAGNIVLILFYIKVTDTNNTIKIIATTPDNIENPDANDTDTGVPILCHNELDLITKDKIIDYRKEVLLIEGIMHIFIVYMEQISSDLTKYDVVVELFKINTEDGEDGPADTPFSLIKKTVIDSDLFYYDDEFKDYFNPLSIQIVNRPAFDTNSEEKEVHITYKTVDKTTDPTNPVYKIKYWTNSYYIPKKISKSENDYFKMTTYGQTLNSGYPELELKYNLANSIKPVYSESKRFPYINTQRISLREYQSYELDKIYIEFDFQFKNLPLFELILFSIGSEENHFILKLKKNEGLSSCSLFANETSIATTNFMVNSHYHIQLFYDKTNKILDINTRQIYQSFVNSITNDLTINIDSGKFNVGFYPFKPPTNLNLLEEDPENSNGHIFNIIVYNCDKTEIIFGDIYKNSLTIHSQYNYDSSGNISQYVGLNILREKPVIDHPMFANENYYFKNMSDSHRVWIIAPMADAMAEVDENDRIYGKYSYIYPLISGSPSYTRDGRWLQNISNETKNKFLDSDGLGIIYDIVKVKNPIFYILLNTAFQTFIETGENRFFLDETYIYQIKNLRNDFTHDDEHISFDQKETFIHKLWFLQKNRTGFEDLENERIELLSMDYFSVNDTIEQIWAVGKVTTENNITYGKIYYSNNMGQTWLENTTHILYPRPSEDINTLNNINYYTYIKTFIDPNGGKWLWIGGNDYLITYSNNYVDGNISGNIDDLGKNWYILGDENPIGEDIDEYTPGGTYFNRAFGEAENFKRNPFILGINLNISYIYPVLIDDNNSKLLFNNIEPNAGDFHVWVGTNSEYPLNKPFTQKMGDSKLETQGFGNTGYNSNYIKYIVIAGSMIYRIGNEFYESDLSDFLVVPFGTEIGGYNFGPVININKDKNPIDQPEYFYEYRIYRCKPIEEIINGEKDSGPSGIDISRFDDFTDEQINNFKNDCKLALRNLSGLNNENFIVKSWILENNNLYNIFSYENISSIGYRQIYTQELSHYNGTYDMVLRGNELSFRKRKNENSVLYKKMKIASYVSTSLGITTLVTAAAIGSVNKYLKLKLTSITFNNINNCLITSDGCVFFSTDGGINFNKILNYEIENDSTSLNYYERVVRGGNIMTIYKITVSNVVSVNAGDTVTQAASAASDADIIANGIVKYTTASSNLVFVEIVTGEFSTTGGNILVNNNDVGTALTIEEDYIFRIVSNTGPWNGSQNSLTVASFKGIMDDSFDVTNVKENWENEVEKNNIFSFWEPGPNLGPTTPGIIDTKNLILTKDNITDNKIQAFDNDNLIYYTDVSYENPTLFYYYKNNSWFNFQISNVLNRTENNFNYSSALLIKNNDNPIIISYINSQDYDIRGFYFIRQTPPTPNLKDPGISANRLYPYQDNYSIKLETLINDETWKTYLTSDTTFGAASIDFEFHYFESKNNEDFIELPMELPNRSDRPIYERFFLEPGTKYDYKVKITSANYGESLESSIVSITTFNDPALIDNFNVKSNYIVNILEWDVKLSSSIDTFTEGEGKQLVYYYDIYKHTSEIGEIKFYKTLTETLFRITGTLRVGMTLTTDFSIIVEIENAINYQFIWQQSDDNITYTDIVGSGSNTSGNETIAQYQLKSENINKWIRLKVVRKDQTNEEPDIIHFSCPRGLVVGSDETLNELLNPQGIETGPTVTKVKIYDTDVKLDSLYTYYIYPKNKLTNRNTFGQIVWNASTFIFDGIPVNFKVDYIKLNNSFKLTWTNLSLPINIDDPEIKYTIAYKIKSKLNDNEEIESEQIHEREKIINDVIINGNYIFQIKAIYTMNGDSDNTKESLYSRPIKYNNNFDIITNITTLYDEDTDIIKIDWIEPLIPYKPEKYKIKFMKNDITYYEFPEPGQNIYNNHFETDGYLIRSREYNVKIFPQYKFTIDGEETILEGAPQSSTLTVPLHTIKYLNYSVNDDIVTLYWNKIMGDDLRYRVEKTPINNGEQCDCPTNSWTIFVCQSTYNETDGWIDPTPIKKPDSYSYDVSVEYMDENEDTAFPCGAEETINPTICCPDKIENGQIILDNNYIDDNPFIFSLNFTMPTLHKNDVLKIIFKYDGTNPDFIGFIKPTHNSNILGQTQYWSNTLNQWVTLTFETIDITLYENNRQTVTIKYIGSNIDESVMFATKLIGGDTNFYKNTTFVEGIYPDEKRAFRQPHKKYTIELFRNNQIESKLYNEDCDVAEFIVFPDLQLYCPDNIKSDYIEGNGNDPSDLTKGNFSFENFKGQNPRCFTNKFSTKVLRTGYIIEITYKYISDIVDPDFKGFFKKKEGLTIKCLDSNFNIDDRTINGFEVESITAYEDKQQTIRIKYTGSDIVPPHTWVWQPDNQSKTDDWHGYHLTIIGDEETLFNNPDVMPTGYTIADTETHIYGEIYEATINIKRPSGKVYARIFDSDCATDEWIRFGHLFCTIGVNNYKFIFGTGKENKFDCIFCEGEYFTGQVVDELGFEFSVPDISGNEIITLKVEYYKYTLEDDPDLYNKGATIKTKGDSDDFLPGWNNTPTGILSTDTSKFIIEYYEKEGGVFIKKDTKLDILEISDWSGISDDAGYQIISFKANQKIVFSPTIKVLLKPNINISLTPDDVFIKNPSYEWGIKTTIKHYNVKGTLVGQLQTGNCPNVNEKIEKYVHPASVDYRYDNFGERVFYPHISPIG